MSNILWCSLSSFYSNETFVHALQKLVPRKATVTLFRELVVNEFSDQIENQQKETKQLLDEVQKQNDPLTKARCRFKPKGESLLNQNSEGDRPLRRPGGNFWNARFKGWNE